MIIRPKPSPTKERRIIKMLKRIETVGAPVCMLPVILLRKLQFGEVLKKMESISLLPYY